MKTMLSFSGVIVCLMGLLLLVSIAAAQNIEVAEDQEFAEDQEAAEDQGSVEDQEAAEDQEAVEDQDSVEDHEVAEDQEVAEEDKIAAEKEMLEAKIAELEGKPVAYFGSKKNKRTRVGFYKYRLEILMEDPDRYFSEPEQFEGNIKTPE